MEQKYHKIKQLFNQIILLVNYIHGIDSSPKQFWYFEKFCLYHGIIGSKFEDMFDSNRINKRQLIKQITTPILCWIFAIKLIVGLLIFIQFDNKTIINYFGYFGNAFGKDKVSVTILSSLLLGMISSFQIFGKLILLS